MNFRKIFVWGFVFFIIFLIFFMIFILMRTFFIEEQYDNFCEIKFGEGFRHSKGSRISESIICEKIDFDSGDATLKYANLLSYNNICPPVDLFDITNWKVDCVIEPGEEFNLYFDIEDFELDCNISKMLLLTTREGQSKDISHLINYMITYNCGDNTHIVMEEKN